MESQTPLLSSLPLTTSVTVEVTNTNNTDNTNNGYNIVNVGAADIADNSQPQNDKIKQLNSMGFYDNTYNQQLLDLFNNDVEKVINFLVSGQ